jgi:5-methylcytosine-specific restriction endonuclease McrA
MGQGWDKKRRPPGAGAGKTTKTAAEIVAELRGGSAPKSGYRERSLKIHGLICAKCGREFEEKERHLLTVHHRDGNHGNNPPDGSNWENLCVYCHEDEHSRGRHHYGDGGR